MIKSGIYKIFISDFFYIGRSGDIEGRINRHKSSLERGTHYNKFMQRVFNIYKEFSYEVIEENPHDIILSEQKYIDFHYKESKCMNISTSAQYTENAEAGYRKFLDPDEIKASAKRRSDSIKSVRSTPESKLKTSIASKHNWTQPGYIEKRRATADTINKSPEYRASQSQKAKAYWDSLSDADRSEWGENVKRSLAGPEVRLKISVATKKALQDPGVRKKISEGLKVSLSNKKTKELRSKISANRWKDPLVKTRMTETVRKSAIARSKNKRETEDISIGETTYNKYYILTLYKLSPSELISIIELLAKLGLVGRFDEIMTRYMDVRNSPLKRKIQLNSSYLARPDKIEVIKSILAVNGYSLAHDYMWSKDLINIPRGD